MRSLKGIRFALALTMLLAGACLARADTFYQGKQIVVLVNFPPGGPTDAEARLLARNLARSVVGSPTVVVHNMGGANGAVAANWLANAAAPDGLILGYFSGIASLRALNDPNLSVGVAKLAFAAAVPVIGVTYGRGDTGGGIKKPADLFAKANFWLGGLRPDSDRDLRLRMQFDLLGLKHNYQSGFASISDARLAFQRGEIQVLLEPITVYRNAIEPSVIANGTAMPLWLDPLDDGETLFRSPEADNLPALTFSDILIQKRGALPATELFDAWRLVNQMGTLFQRILVLAPGTPPAALEALRKGIAKLTEDAAFKEDALKTIKIVPGYLTDAKTAAIFARVTDPEPRLQKFLRDYIDKIGAAAVNDKTPAGDPPPRKGTP